MQKTQIAPSILQPFLESARNAADKGQSQFFTPPEFGAALVPALSAYRGVITDLTCGAGHLLHAARNKTTKTLLGADIDPCKCLTHLDGSPLSVQKISHDLTLLYPLLKEVRWQGDLFVLNPPWSLEWHTDRLVDLANSELEAVRSAYTAINSTVIDSTIATLMMALDLSTGGGEGLLIANKATLERLLFGQDAPFSALVQHLWLHVVVDGNPMTGIAGNNWEENCQTGVIYFARDHKQGPHHLKSEISNLKSLLPHQRVYRQGAQLYGYLAHGESESLWDVVKGYITEMTTPARRRGGGYHLWLQGNVIETNLSVFESNSVKVDKSEAQRLFKLNGRVPMQLVLQRADREELLHVAQKAGWRVHPDLLTAVQKAIAEYHAARAPLYPLSPIKRLGYLDEQDEIECKRDLALDNHQLIFRAGVKYKLRTHTVKFTRTGTKPNAVTGEIEDVEYAGMELGIFIKAEGGMQNEESEEIREYAFMDGNLRAENTSVQLAQHGADGDSSIDFTLQQLCDHFVIPEVADVAQNNPAGYQRALDDLTRLEEGCGFTLKLFQKQDLARAALHAGLILGWDTGLGKTWTLYLLPLLQCGFHLEMQKAEGGIQKSPHCETPVLIVAPGDLHGQIMLEARDVFHIETASLDSQETFNRLCRPDGRVLPLLTSEGRPIIPPGFYITSYTQLTTNGVAPMPDVEKWDPRALLDYLALQEFPKVGRVTPCAPSEKLTGADNHWPLTVSEFFTLRCEATLWREEYRLFKLDHRFSNKAELDQALEASLAELEGWEDRKAASNRRKRFEAAYAILEKLVPVRIRRLSTTGAEYDDLAEHQRAFVIAEFVRRKIEEYSVSNGEIRAYPIGPKPPGYIEGKPETDSRLKWKIKCVYSPSLADLCYNAFDAVSIDEGVRLKSADSLVGLGCRSLEPRFRNLATATPIKNKLPDLFSLLWWAAGGHAEPTARFPYRDDPADRKQFNDTFMVGAEITGHDNDGKTRTRHAVTAQVCNIHKLWKLLGPLILRRRKQDCGEDLVKRVRRIIRCQMGTEQRDVYEYHLKASYVDCNGLPAIGPQLQALRQAAVAPATDKLLAQLGSPDKPCPDCSPTQGSEFKVQGPRLVCKRCNGQGRVRLPHRAAVNYIPKTATVLTLIQEIVARREQVLVGAAFNEPNDELSRLLSDAGVRHLVLDGRVSQKRRSVLAQQFKLGPNAPRAIPVMLAGCDSMAEGHSFHRCRNVILYAYTWAWDKFKQLLDRVHRLNSPEDINVYVVLCEGTIDRRLESLTDEKGHASDLVLDGRLLDERLEEVSFAELLQVAQSEFRGDGQAATIDEGKLLSEWPPLREALRRAAAEWDGPVPKAACPDSESIEGRMQNEEVAVSIEPVKTPETPSGASFNSIPLQFTFENPAVSVFPPSYQAEKMTISNPIPPSCIPEHASVSPSPAWRERIAQRATRLRGLTGMNVATNKS